MRFNKSFCSPNRSQRNSKIEYIIIHYTGMKCSDGLTKLCDKESKVSAHYFIKQDGEIFQLVDDSYIAWHAGKSYWKGLSELNKCSIGIELDNLGMHKFSQVQMNNCIELCKHLIKIHSIPPKNILGHSDVAPSRKIDPGIFFNWRMLASHGLGVKYQNQDITDFDDNSNKILYNYLDFGDGIVKLQSKLQKIGYQISVNGSFDEQTNFAIKAFNLHFNPDSIKLSQKFNLQLLHEYICSWDERSENIMNLLLNS
ncbi:MAG: N-acetylmuramoyl-L-alanine amidase [Rickettsiaceae bacterium]